MNSNTSKSYSSVKEALWSGILEQHARHDRAHASSSASSTSRSRSPRLRTADAGSSIKIHLSPYSPPIHQIDVSGMTRRDLQRLKAEDPFLYYSIPEMRHRSYRFEHDETDGALGDAPPLQEGAAAHDPRRGDGRVRAPAAGASLPPGLNRPPNNVIRKCRLSVEAHPTLVTEDMDLLSWATGQDGDEAS